MAILADTVKLGWIDEVTPGVTPATPAFSSMRLTGESVSFAPTIVESAELTPGRGLADSALTGGNATGDFNFELSTNAAFEKLLATAMASDWGDLQGFLAAQMPGGVWTADSIACGQKIKTGSFLKEFPVAGTTPIHVFPGLLANTMQFTITPGAIITGTFGMIGGTIVDRTTEFTGQTWVAPAANGLFTAPKVVAVDLKTVAGGSLGIGIGTYCFTNLVINLNNNIKARECIGFLGAKERALGKANVTLTATVYFTNNDILDLLIAQTEFRVEVTLSDSMVSPNNHRYVMQFPRCKLTASPITAGGAGQDVVVEAAITALTPASIPNSPILLYRSTS